MNDATLIAELGARTPLPPAERRALVDRALANVAELVPELVLLADKAATGVVLLPWQEQALHAGLHLAAAAGRSELAAALRRLVAADPVIVERVLGDESIAIGASLLVSLHDGDDAALVALAADTDMDGEARWIACLALARLAVDRRVERTLVVDLLKRWERDRGAPNGDLAWEGWQDAVVHLGVVDLAPALEAVWDDGRLPQVHAEDRDELRRRLAWSAAHPHDPAQLDDEGIAPVADVQAQLGWLRGPLPPPPPGARRDPAFGVALDEAERDWLAAFLTGPQAPATSFTLEMVDGLFAAVAAGPAAVPPSEYLPILWGDEGALPRYDSPEQEEYVDQLLLRHMDSLAKRLARGHPHAPILFPATLDQTARSWARGFVVGLSLRSGAWQAMLDDEDTAAPVTFIGGLIQDEMGDEPVEGETRAQIIEHLPELLRAIHAYWRRPAPPPPRAAKIGRNDPCPCGSGRKFKKCCAAS